MAPYLCQDVISSILIRVPADDVVRFKIVSKLWRSFIADPHFEASQFHHWRKQEEIIFATSTSSDSESKSLSDAPIKTLWSVDTRGKDIKLQQFSTQFPSRTWCVKSSCDGLLLVLDGPKTLFVCNPATRRCKILPDAPPEFRSMEDYSWVLCRDASSGKYKVFGAVDERCILLSQGDSSWRELQSGYSCSEGKSQPIRLNNKLHWLQDFHLVSFDVATEKFSLTNIPVRWGFIRGCDYPCLYEVKGSICLVSVSLGKLDIFVLEKMSAGDWRRCYRAGPKCLPNIPKSLIDDKTNPKSLTGFLRRDVHLVPKKDFDGCDYSDLIKIVTFDKDECLCYDFKRRESKKIADLRLGGGEISLCGKYHSYFGSLISW